jgi:N12 class adenine-specific DNA methylase
VRVWDLQDIYFDDLGVDRLFVDEAQAYKAQAIFTKMGNIAGISTRESQLAQRILAKIEFTQETHNGAGVIFTTATPIENTRCKLRRAGHAHGIRPYGVTIKPKTALANYINVSEIQSIRSQFSDVMMQSEARKPALSRHKQFVVEPIAGTAIQQPTGAAA